MNLSPRQTHETLVYTVLFARPRFDQMSMESYWMRDVRYSTGFWRITDMSSVNTMTSEEICHLTEKTTQ